MVGNRNIKRNQGVEAELERAKAMPTVSFAHPFISKCFKHGNEMEFMRIHSSFMGFMYGLESKLGDKDSCVYGAIYIATQVLAKHLNNEEIFQLRDDFCGSPFEKLVEKLLSKSDDFLEMVNSFDLMDLISFLIIAPYNSGKDDGDKKRSSFLHNVALNALVDLGNPFTTYADFGGGYGDFAMLLAKTGIPCSGSFHCEIDREAVITAAARLSVIAYPTRFSMGDIFKPDWKIEFDRIFCEPSFFDSNDVISDEYLSVVEERYGHSVSYKDHDWLYALCVAEHLTAEGKALVAVKQKSLDDPESENGRRILLEQKVLAGIVNLPDYLFDNEEDRLAIAVIKKGCNDVRICDSNEVDDRGGNGNWDGYVMDRLNELLRSL